MPNLTNNQNSISCQSSILSNLMNINNSKKKGIQSTTTTPNKNLGNENYFASQDKVLNYQNQNINNFNAPSSNLKMNLNNLMNNSSSLNNQYPASSGSLFNTNEKFNGNQKSVGISSSNLPQKNVNTNLNDINTFNYINKFMNNYQK